jgi:hypothetical protein
MSNRRLVPMPRDTHGGFVKRTTPTPLPHHTIFPRRHAVPPMQWPPENYDVMALARPGVLDRVESPQRPVERVAGRGRIAFGGGRPWLSVLERLSRHRRDVEGLGRGAIRYSCAVRNLNASAT